MKKKGRVIAAGIAIHLCVIAGIYVVLQPKIVLAETLVVGEMTRRIAEQGKLVPQHKQTILADTSGIVRGMNAKVGHDQATGDLLLTIDSSLGDREIENQIAGLKAQQTAVYATGQLTENERQLRMIQLHQQLEGAINEYEHLFGDDGVANQLLSSASSSYAYAKRTYRLAREEYEDRDEEFSQEVTALRLQMQGAEDKLILAEYQASETNKSYFEGLIASYEAELALLKTGESYSNNNIYAMNRQLQLTIDHLNERLGRGEIVVQQDGIIWELMVSEGDYVMENQAVAVIYKDEGFYLEGMLLGEDALMLKEGDEVSCRFSDNSLVTGQVRFISPVAEQVVSTIGLTEDRCRVDIEVTHQGDNLGAGHRADLLFQLTVATDVLSLPATAILPYEGGHAVYRIEEGKAKLVPVETGLRQGGRVEIISGLSEGEQVVINPFDSTISNNSFVKISS